MSAESIPLRQAVLRGAAYLAIRQIISVALKMTGVLLITRLLGPSAYGAYVSAFSIYQYALLVGQAGIGMYLLRAAPEQCERASATAYSMLAAMALVFMLALELCRGAVSGWIGVDGFSAVASVIVFALPFQLLAVPAVATIERRLDYRAIAVLEISGQLCYYLLAAPLVMLHWGPVSLAIALCAQQAVSCIAAHVFAGTRPRFRFDRAMAKSIFAYAGAYSFANWIWQLRMLVNPLIVGPSLGAEAVGMVGLTNGLLDVLSVVKNTAWRLSAAILSRFQDDRERLRRAIAEGMELQALAMGALLLGFGWFGGFVIPCVFGERWAPVMDIYPYIALGYFTNALFNIHSSVLALLRQNMHVAAFHLVHVGLFAGTAALLVPRWGTLGYGLGEMTALLSYVVLHHFTARAVGRPNYSATAIWWLGTAIGLFWHDLGFWAIAAPFVALVISPSPARIRFHYKKARP
jgi:PST family polysaccharide transporter